jgi:hypothetical protein
MIFSILLHEFGKYWFEKEHIMRAAPDDTAETLTKDYPASTPRFDWIMAGLSVWITGGLFLDGWAHAHGNIDDVFFTPWHAVLYSGGAAIIGFLVYQQRESVRQGRPWRQALPAGYLFSLVGGALFVVAGVSDLIWHKLFGVEVSVESLLSPTHLLLVLAGGMMISGPIRSIWGRFRAGGQYGWLRLGPMLICATLFLSTLMFFTQYANPINTIWAAYHPIGSSEGFRAQALGVASILVHAVLLIGPILYLIARWRLPIGTMTLIFTLSTALMSVFQDHYVLIPYALVSGILADGLLMVVKPTTKAPIRFYTFAFLAPALFFSLYFLAVQLTQGGIAWKIHLWLGSIFITGAIGVMLAWLVVSPLWDGETT